jgi:hypothetical protein
MANEVVAVTKTTVRMEEKKCKDLEETLEEFFSNS